MDEGVPSVIEAICIGVPVIATDVGGTAETIDNKNNDYCRSKGNENELYKGIKRFLQNKIHFVETARMSSEAIKVFFFFPTLKGCQFTKNLPLIGHIRFSPLNTNRFKDYL